MNQANVVVISPETIRSLRNVKRTDNLIKVGSFFATDGAWDRKHVAVGVKVSLPKDSEREMVIRDRHHWQKLSSGTLIMTTEVTLMPIGRIYADGRVTMAKRNRTVTSKILTVLVDGELRNLNYSSYVQVEPKNA
jgi:hypothetical protein